MSTAKQRRKKRKEKRSPKRIPLSGSKVERAIGSSLRAKVIAEVQRISGLLGFTMEGRLLDGGADHWMFNDGAYRLMNYWPTNGRWYDQKSGHKGIEKDVMVVLEMVETVFNERKKK